MQLHGNARTTPYQRREIARRVLEQAEPVYEELPGWQEDITSARRLSDLPENARRYLDRIREIADVPIGLVSVGQGRDQTIVPGD